MVLMVGVLLGFSPAAASVILPLWGVSSEDNSLFCVADYTDFAGTYTNYGQLEWDNAGTVEYIPGLIKAFAVDADKTAYMVTTGTVGATNPPVLLSFDLNQASTTNPNVATVIGQVGVTLDHDWDCVSGLAVHPSTRQLYGLFRDDKGGLTDKLISIDKATATTTVIGGMYNTPENVAAGEDLAFDLAGNCYVTDDDDDELYRVDISTATVLAVVDGVEEGGLAGLVEFEALAWDPVGSKLIGFDDKRNEFDHITLQDGNNAYLGWIPGLDDVEGMGFEWIPEPITLPILLLGSTGILLRTHRRRIRT